MQRYFRYAVLFQFCKWIDYCYGENYINRHYDMSLLPDAGKEQKNTGRIRKSSKKELSGKDQEIRRSDQGKCKS